MDCVICSLFLWGRATLSYRYNRYLPPSPGPYNRWPGMDCCTPPQVTGSDTPPGRKHSPRMLHPRRRSKWECYGLGGTKQRHKLSPHSGTLQKRKPTDKRITHTRERRTTQEQVELRRVVSPDLGNSTSPNCFKTAFLRPMYECGR